MDKEFRFFVYLLESYAVHKKMKTGDVLRLLDNKGLKDYVFSMYEIYHSEAIENAYRDLDSLISTGKPAY